MNIPLEFDQISYNEPVYWLEQHWGRKLTDHEKSIVTLIYRYTRTTQEAEEIKILEHVDKPVNNVDKSCVLCQDVAQRVSLKGELFCNQCFEDVYL